MQTKIKVFLNLLDKKRRLQVVGLVILTVAASFCELLGIGAVIPFLSIIVSPEQLYSYPVATQFLEFFDINSQLDAIKLFAFMFFWFC